MQISFFVSRSVAAREPQLLSEETYKSWSGSWNDGIRAANDGLDVDFETDIKHFPFSDLVVATVSFEGGFLPDGLDDGLPAWKLPVSYREVSEADIEKVSYDTKRRNVL
jgi:hypothetical protein